MNNKNSSPTVEEVVAPTTSTKKIHKAMAAVMADIRAVEKDEKTLSGPRYAFRSIYGVYAAIQPVLAKHRIFMRVAELKELRCEHGQTRNNTMTTTCLVHVTYAFVAEDGSEITTQVLAEGTDTSDKAYNKALSVSQKYAIVQAFCIPDKEADDGEAERIEKNQVPLADPARVKTMLDAFGKLGIDKPELEQYVSKSVAEFNILDMESLGMYYRTSAKKEPTDG